MQSGRQNTVILNKTLLLSDRQTDRDRLTDLRLEQTISIITVIKIQS